MSKVINLKDVAEEQFNSFVEEVKQERKQFSCKHKNWLFDEDGGYMECADCKKIMAPLQYCKFLAYEANGVKAQLRKRYMVLEEIEYRIESKSKELSGIEKDLRIANRKIREAMSELDGLSKSKIIPLSGE